jgi:hypothetical protein
VIALGPEQKGLRQYISKFGLPAGEAFEKWHFKNGLPDFGNTVMDYLSTMNPIIKAPLEQLFDYQFHTHAGCRTSRPAPNRRGGPPPVPAHQ